MSQQFEFSVKWHVTLRLALSALILFLVLLRLLLSRGFLALPQRVDIDPVWGDLWPDLILIITLILAIRMMLVKSKPNQSRRFRWFGNAVVMFGFVMLLTHIMIDQAVIPALVHMAVESVEYSHAIPLQRPNIFPSHVAEGFRSFWQATIAAGAALLASAMLLVAPSISNTLVRLGLAIAFVASMIGLALYDRWFVLYEFPRLSPELADAGLAGLWSDFAAGGLLLFGLVLWIASKSAAREQPSVTVDIGFPKVSGVGVLGAVSIAVGAGLNWIVLVRQSLWSYEFLYGWQGFWESVQTISAILLSRDLIFQLALFVSAGSFLLQAFRLTEGSVTLAVLKKRNLLGYSFAWLLLFGVAIPTLAIFGFCYWLGPFIL